MTMPMGPGAGAPGGSPSGGPPPSGPGGPPMMPPQAPPAPPVGAPVGGPTPASPTPFTDVSDKLPSHYQLLDVAASTIEQAINSGGFYREPKVLAGVRSIHSQLSHLIANGARSGTAGSTPEGPSQAPSIEGEGDLPGDSPDEEDPDALES